MQCSLKRRRSQKCHFYSFLRCTCNMQLMTLLGFRRNISYFKAPVRCIGRLLFAGRHTNMFLVDDCKNIERLLRSVVLPHLSKETGEPYAMAKSVQTNVCSYTELCSSWIVELGPIFMVVDKNSFDPI